MFDALIIGFGQNRKSLPASFLSIRLIGRYAYPIFPDDGYMGVYGTYLIRGYPLWTTVPASMAVHRETWGTPMVMDATDLEYLLMRGFVTAVIAFVILTALALQARWLGLIARLDCREALAF